ncbi:hypothetical protein HK099_001210 [Clydaea vesicula]|uniref:Dethiobiotin synthase n=1 Tax=Clydaea vesicula TaxID=447962 RepID=A0AAD5Y1X5_9FUNG|nr:hypothetical protein HK099_001210 [Clydaea vesicula]
MFSETLPIYLIFGANTDVGKTICTTSIVNSASINGYNPAYIKPVQTGYPLDSDAEFVRRYTNASVQTLYSYSTPASPHLTALEENRVISDEDLLIKIEEKILETMKLKTSKLLLLETAGGVNSPTMSGTLQSDVFRKFRFPVILIGDSKLGGISTTISSYESLKIRGYDVPILIFFENKKYLNHEIIKQHVSSETTIFLLTTPPKNENLHNNNGNKDLVKYFEDSAKTAELILKKLAALHKARFERLKELNDDGEKKVWWPFTQHRAFSQGKRAMVIDSAYNDDFTIFKPDEAQYSSDRLFDGCASWWTQGLGHGNPHMAKEAAYAAGRYGHVISPEAIHEPAQALAEEILSSAGKDWASRVFYSDNGSTAIEVALKMAFTKTSLESQKKMLIDKPSNEIIQWNVIGLEGSYHGDTIGAMDISDPSVYNAKVHWYTGKGFWFNPPTYYEKNKRFYLNISDSIVSSVELDTEEIEFNSMAEIFSVKRNKSYLRKVYNKYIVNGLKKFLQNNLNVKKKFGALVIEPLILGAGGMLFIDPLFQKELIFCARNPELWDASSPPLPVVFDEIFVGMYRLGVNLPSVASLFTCDDDFSYLPDIACYAKCLTGGLLPLSVTVTTDEIFKVFDGDSKLEALLHGHSYTAHPIGCQVALYSLKEYKKISLNKKFEWTIWDAQLLTTISCSEKVARVNSFGTILVVELNSQMKGYLSNKESLKLVENLKSSKGIFCRPLGNLVYFMASQRSLRKDLDLILNNIWKAIQDL